MQATMGSIVMPSCRQGFPSSSSNPIHGKASRSSQSSRAKLVVTRATLEAEGRRSSWRDQDPLSQDRNPFQVMTDRRRGALGRVWQYNFGGNYLFGADGIRQRSSAMASMANEWEPAMEELLEHLGASPTQTLRLVNVGAKWQPDSHLTRLYRDPEALYGALRAIDTYVPGMCLLTALVRYPEVALLGLAPSHLTRWVAELRVALPEVDLPMLLARCPEILLGQTKQGETVCASRMAASWATLRTLLPALSVPQAVEHFPQILLHTPEEIEQGVQQLSETFHPQCDADELALKVQYDPERIVRPHLRAG